MKRPFLFPFFHAPLLLNDLSISRSYLSLSLLRAAIEKQYSKSLLGWAERWEEKLRTLGENYTLRDGWQGVLTEARGHKNEVGKKERREGERQRKGEEESSGLTVRPFS